MTFGQEVLRQLEYEGKKIPLETSWQEIPAETVAIFCRKPWENCQAVSLAIAYGEEAFVNLKEDKTNVGIFLLPRKIPLFFQKKEEAPVISKPFRRKKSASAFRNLSLILP